MMSGTININKNFQHRVSYLCTKYTDSEVKDSCFIGQQSAADKLVHSQYFYLNYSRM